MTTQSAPQTVPQTELSAKSDYIVAKFGGTSVANFEAMSRCSEIIVADKSVRIVAVSASAGVTNHLVALCKSSITPSERQEHINGVLAIQQTILDELSLDADLAVGFNETLKAFLCQVLLVLLRFGYRERRLNDYPISATNSIRRKIRLHRCQIWWNKCCKF